ncbi:hydrogenase 4 membrane subunit [Vibrio mediterranei]
MNDLLINNLAGLLVITSFMVVIAKQARTAAVLYAIQSLVLVGIFCVIANSYQAHELFSWAMTAVISKVILLPVILFVFLGKLQDAKAEQPLMHPAWIVMLVALISIGAFYGIAPVQVPLVANLKPTLAVSLAHFFIGLLCIVSQRNILKQVFGYCLMENGSSLTLALLAHDAPHLMEVGITIDAIFAVVVMVILARLIYRQLGTLDVQQLTTLKG